MSDNRFWDDLHLVPVEQYQPTTVRALLRHLHLDTATPADQETGIQDWLATHTPSPMLTHSFRDSGYSHLIELSPRPVPLTYNGQKGVRRRPG